MGFFPHIKILLGVMILTISIMGCAEGEHEISRDFSEISDNELYDETYISEQSPIYAPDTAGIPSTSKTPTQIQVSDGQSEPLPSPTKIKQPSPSPTPKIFVPDYPTDPWYASLFSFVPQVYEGAGFEKPGVTPIFYEGLDYRGKSTRIFAYYGVPEVPKGEKVPGVVLVHGGGATASDAWVRHWNSKGYAAISMDLEGHTPDMKKHAYSGPERNGIFGDIGAAIENQWMYHAGAGVVIANTLLASFPEVDSNKIGIAGISWGGIISGIISGVDRRFGFAIHVYGCGYLNESKTYFGPAMTPGRMIWDPSRFFVNATMPSLWINGDSDSHFSLDIFSKSYSNYPAESYLTIYPGMGHSMQAGWNPSEIYNFADSITKEKTKPAKITRNEISGETGRIDFESEKEIKQAMMIYNKESNLVYNTGFNGVWNVIDIEVTSQAHIEYLLPEGAMMFYVNIIDEDDLISSSPLYTVE